MIKRYVSLVIALLFCLSMTGCMSAAEELDISSRAPGEEHAAIGIANPQKEMSRQELIEATGIDLGEPEGAENLVYSIIELTEGNPVAQLRFTMNGEELCLRAQSVDGQAARDISGLYYEWKTQEITYIMDRPAMSYCSDGVGYIKWLDIAPAIQYSLSMTEGAELAKLKDYALAVFVPQPAED